MKLAAPCLLLGALTGCFYGDEWAEHRATEAEIVDAAARCGLPNFEVTKSDAGLAAYVPNGAPNAKAKEDCIYADLGSRGRLVTR